MVYDLALDLCIKKGLDFFPNKFRVNLARGLGGNFSLELEAPKGVPKQTGTKTNGQQNGKMASFQNYKRLAILTPILLMCTEMHGYQHA